MLFLRIVKWRSRLAFHDSEIGIFLAPTSLSLLAPVLKNKTNKTKPSYISSGIIS